MGEWQYIDNPLEHVQQSKGLLNEETEGTKRTESSIQKTNKSLSAARKAKVDKATIPENGIMSWSVYEESIESRKERDSKSKNRNNQIHQFNFE